MKALRHKIKGTAQIIGRDERFITIKYDRDGYISNVKFPEGFMTDMFVIDEELQRDVDAAVLAKKEAERIAFEEREAQRAIERAATKVCANGTKRSGKTFVAIKRTGDIEKDFESFLKTNKYSEETKNRTKSTIYSYVNAVKSCMESEGLDWTSLMKHISQVIRIYDVGGMKEETGYKGNHTVINALRRFEDFVNHSTP